MPTLTCATVAGAAPVWVRDKVTHWSGSAAVVHSGPDALYLQAGHDVVAVLSRHAVQVPNGIRTALPTTGHLTPNLQPPAVGTLVRIDDKRLHFQGADVHIARIVSCAAPEIIPSAASDMVARLAVALEPAARGVREELPDNQLRALAMADPRAVVGLLGRGSGLTPLGDDVLCGWLATVATAAHPCGARFAAEVHALADQRTTALSATLLRRAAHAEVIPQFSRLLRALTHRPDTTDEAVGQLARVGHTSGLGLALGLSIALDHLASRSSCS